MLKRCNLNKREIGLYKDCLLHFRPTLSQLNALNGEDFKLDLECSLSRSSIGFRCRSWPNRSI